MSRTVSSTRAKRAVVVGVVSAMVLMGAPALPGVPDRAPLGAGAARAQDAGSPDDSTGLDNGGPDSGGPAEGRRDGPISLSRTEETLFRADEVIHHNEIGVTVLRGNVEIAQAGRVLLADTVSYNRESDTLSASGDVVLMQPSGNVAFSSYAEITSDGFKNGVIEDIRMLLTDGAKVAANGARRTDGNRTRMAKAVYSPCDVCRDDPDRSPLWQVKAREITHDDANYLLQYEDAWLEIAGVPVLYTPYFEHYDPRVERKSGFLIPSFGSTSGLGQFIQPRYFYAISKDKDLTVAPVVSVQGEGILAGEYRQDFNRGQIELDASLGNLEPVSDVAGDSQIGSGRQARGHIRGEGYYNIDDTWRAGFELARATDKTYNQAYPLFELPSTQLVSRGYVEGFRGRSYATAEMLSIQSLRVQEPAGYREQDVIPRLAYRGLGQPDALGGRWQFDTEARFLAVEDDDDTHRFTVKPGYGFTRSSTLGFKTRFETTVQANAYLIEQDRPGSGNKAYEEEGYILPKASLEVSYPFVRHGERTTQTIEPLVFGSAAPDTDPPDSVTFEDNSSYELDEINVFAHERLNGDDVAEGGSRAAAGVRYGLDWGEDLSFDTTLARMFATTRNAELTRRIDTGSGKYDWVGAARISYGQWGTVGLRLRRPELVEGGSAREELDFGVGPDIFRLAGNYTFVDDSYNGPTAGDSEYLGMSVTSAISDNWAAQASINHDFGTGETRRISAWVEWRNECALIRASWRRRNTSLQNEFTNDTYLVTVGLKTLGEYGFEPF